MKHQTKKCGKHVIHSPRSYWASWMSACSGRKSKAGLPVQGDHDVGHIRPSDLTQKYGSGIVVRTDKLLCIPELRHRGLVRLTGVACPTTVKYLENWNSVILFHQASSFQLARMLPDWLKCLNLQIPFLVEQLKVVLMNHWCFRGSTTANQYRYNDIEFLRFVPLAEGSVESEPILLRIFQDILTTQKEGKTEKLREQATTQHSTPARQILNSYQNTSLDVWTKWGETVVIPCWALNNNQWW